MLFARSYRRVHNRRFENLSGAVSKNVTPVFNGGGGVFSEHTGHFIVF